MAADPESDSDSADDVGDADDGQQWRFSLSDLEDEDAESADEGSETDSDSESGGNIAGSLDIDEELEAESIDIENAVFVLVGVFLTVGFILAFVMLLF